MSTDRRFHTDSRASENFTKNGLETLTGQSSGDWGRYVVKELVDNALEAVEAGADEPAVSVTLDTEGTGRHAYVRRVTVADNGPGIARERLEKIADAKKFGGTKRHYALPTRGTQGNALMTIIGIQHLADGGPLIIGTRGTRYEIQVDADTVSGKPAVSVVSTEPQEETPDRGTRVHVEFGDSGRKWASFRQAFYTLAGFSALNPHVSFDTSVSLSEAATDTTTQYSPRGNATTGRVHWFDQSAFEERVKADLRADPSLTVKAFVREFDGLRGHDNATAAINETQLVDIDPGDSIQAALTTNADGQPKLDEPATAALRLSMVNQTREWSDTNVAGKLGQVGESLSEGARRLIEQYGHESTLPSLLDQLQQDGADIDSVEELTISYQSEGIATSDDGQVRQPFVFELAAIPMPEETKTTETPHQFGINQSVAYSTPKATVNFDDTTSDRRHTSIKSAFNEEAHEFVVVSNLTCPNIPFKDKGKQSFPTEPFEDAISEVVGKAIRKYQRDLRPMLNSLEEDDSDDMPTLPEEKKAPHGFVKEAVFELFDEVYENSTKGGELTITMRQLFYRLRDEFNNLAEQRGIEYKWNATLEDPEEIKLEYGTFTDYVDDYEREVLGERVVHRDNRGFFVEPHSERRIELSTKKVDQYDPSDAVFKEYDTLLFIEKTGFYEQFHQDAEINKQFDIGLINAQGYSTNAIRDLAEKAQATDQDVRLLTLTDLDVNGVGIAEDANRADPLGKAVAFGAERLGVSPADVEEYDLDVESVSYNSEQLEKLKTRYNDGEIDKATYEFLSNGNRAEINAFAPPELEVYVTERLEELGVEKISPSVDEVETPDVDSREDVREKAIDRAISKYVRDQIDDDLRESLIEEDEELELDDEDEEEAAADAEEVHEELTDRLEDRPPKSWQELNEEVNDELTEDLKERNEELSDTVESAVEELLNDQDIISVSTSDDS